MGCTRFTAARSQGILNFSYLHRTRITININSNHGQSLINSTRNDTRFFAVKNCRRQTPRETVTVFNTYNNRRFFCFFHAATIWKSVLFYWPHSNVKHCFLGKNSTEDSYTLLRSNNISTLIFMQICRTNNLTLQQTNYYFYRHTYAHIIITFTIPSTCDYDHAYG